MPLFAFKSNNHFVASSDGIVLHIYELTKSSVHLSSIQKVDWKKVATIDTDLRDDDDDDDIDPMVPKMSCDGLLFFDGHGRIEGREALTMLAKHLRQLHLLVNPEGYCFQEVSEFGVYSDFGIHYVRLNDLFSWPRHKVDLATTNVWSRLELKYSLPKHKNTSQPPTVGGGVSKEKYAELEKSVKEKDDELEKLKEEMDGATEKMKKENEEQQKKAQKKDKELQMLKKKKVEEEEAKAQRIEQLEKLNEDLEEANKVKDDELQKLKKKKDEEEMTKLQRIEELEKVNEDLEEANKAKDEELQKELENVNEELEEANRMKDEEMQKLLKEKSQELEVLEKKKEMEKNDEAAKTRKVERELKEARDKLSSIVAQMKKELEECQKKSWAILPSTKFLPQNLDEKEKYLAMRQPVPPGTFSFRSQLSSCYVNNSHKLMDKMRVDHDYTIRLVDEESSPPEWPPLPMVTVQIGSENEDFDQNNWWYLKTTHPDGGLTMLVFYDGNRSQVSHDNHFSESDSIIPLPFSKGLEVYTYVHTFSIFRLHPFGVKFGFAYRPK
ncbi:Laminin subunit alpha-2 [Linum perenne]